MTDDIVRHIAEALIEQHGATAAVEVAETLASVTSGSGVEFWGRVVDFIRAMVRGEPPPDAD